MTTFYVIIFVTLVLDFALLGALVWAFHAKRFVPYRIPGYAPMKVSPKERAKTMAVIGVLSFFATVGMIHGLSGVLLSTKPASAWVIGFEALAILAVYDIAYYFLHRTMHHKKLMRFVHGVHHRARYPTALESLYQHPIELLSGLALLMVSTWAVGPVHPLAFAAAFFVYSTLNILIHSGMEFPHPLLKPLNILTRKHHIHHAGQFGRNYASLTPLPDILFRTAA